MIIAIAATSTRDSDNDSDSSGGYIFLPRFWIGPDIFWFFDFDYGDRRRRKPSGTNKMNFLEAVFSFLFGDGNPNADLEETRWQTIGTVIRNHQGAVVGEQIAPYLDNIDADEDYMIPVLSRFNGYPQVSPQGEIIYYFPELQVMARERKQKNIGQYLQEKLWLFSQASSEQRMLVIGLGAANLILALILGSLLRDGTVAATLGGLVAFVSGIYPILLGYAGGFLLIPLVRYFWLQRRNSKIKVRNQQRQEQVIVLNQADSSLQQKIVFASQFANQKVINQEDIAYTTEEDLLAQNLKNADKIDGEWQRRLESDS
jgi:hypothetical protein